MQNKINEKIELSGNVKVWVGDPCYVIPDTLWGKVCEQIFAGTNYEVNQIIGFDFGDLRRAGVPDKMLDNCAGRKCVFIQSGTMYGDGFFQGMTGFCYGVDAGCLAVVPEYLIDPEKLNESERLGKFFEVQEFVALQTDGNGKFIFSDAKGTFEIIETDDNEQEA